MALIIIEPEELKRTASQNRGMMKRKVLVTEQGVMPASPVHNEPPDNSAGEGIVSMSQARHLI
jgi:hypothetical protein